MIKNLYKKMISYIRALLRKRLGFRFDSFAEKNNLVLAYYFDGLVNVGDLITPYLVKKITGKEVQLSYTGKFKHLFAVGSIMHNANENSYIWGSGFLSEKYKPEKIDPKKIYALRGFLSKKIASNDFNKDLKDIALGDPALLMPYFYSPALKNKKYKIGVVPHYVDMETVKHYLLGRNDVLLLDVRQEPESFISDMYLCDCVISSSLHGLILSDAYNIPNKWVVFSEKVLGSGFKFHDYYSTTSSEDEQALYVKDEIEFNALLNNVNSYTYVKKSTINKDYLLKSFPKSIF